MEKHCRICGVSSEEKPLIVYANEDFSKWLYLCRQCHDRLIARTGGIIPLSLFKGDADARGNNRLPAKRGMDLSRTAFKEEAKPIDVYSSKGLGILKGYILQEA